MLKILLILNLKYKVLSFDKLLKEIMHAPLSSLVTFGDQKTRNSYINQHSYPKSWTSNINWGCWPLRSLAGKWFTFATYTLLSSIHFPFPLPLAVSLFLIFKFNLYKFWMEKLHEWEINDLCCVASVIAWQSMQNFLVVLSFILLPCFSSFPSLPFCCA